MLRRLVLAPALALSSLAGAGTVPDAAKGYRLAVVREARLVWGMEAPIALFGAQLMQESGFNPRAVSAVGAVGLAQFMPATARWWCRGQTPCDPTNPRWAIRAMVGYDHWLFERVWGAQEAKLWAMLRSYNGGLGHWQAEARLAGSAETWAVDARCGQTRRSKVHCAENLGYPKRIFALRSRFDAWQLPAASATLGLHRSANEPPRQAAPATPPQEGN